MMKKLVTTILLAMALQPINLLAQQCEVANTAFKEGESVRYDLYFDWGIIWKRWAMLHSLLKRLFMKDNLPMIFA